MLNVADSEDVIIQRIYKSHRPSQIEVVNTQLLKLDDMGIMRMQFAIAGISFTKANFDTLSTQLTASTAA
jgi:3-deoxy-D-manno-octulosonic-acid transferase